MLGRTGAGGTARTWKRMITVTRDASQRRCGCRSFRIDRGGNFAALVIEAASPLEENWRSLMYLAMISSAGLAFGIVSFPLQKVLSPVKGMLEVGPALKAIL